MDGSAEILLQSLFACLLEAIVTLFDFDRPAFPLPTAASPCPRCPEGGFWRGCQYVFVCCNCTCLLCEEQTCLSMIFMCKVSRQTVMPSPHV